METGNWNWSFLAFSNVLLFPNLALKCIFIPSYKKKGLSLWKLIWLWNEHDMIFCILLLFLRSCPPVNLDLFSFQIHILEETELWTHLLKDPELCCLAERVNPSFLHVFGFLKAHFLLKFPLLPQTDERFAFMKCSTLVSSCGCQTEDEVLSPAEVNGKSVMDLDEAQVSCKMFNLISNGWSDCSTADSILTPPLLQRVLSCV